MVESSPSLLQDFALIIVAGAVALVLFRKINQPPILGYLLTGVLLGPYTLPVSLVGNVETIRMLADIGLVVLLFALGVELGWDRIRRVGFRVVLIGGFEISLMVAVGYLVGLLLGWNATEAFFLGAAVSISSSAVIIKMMRDSGELRSARGQLVVGILVVEDFAAVVLLSILASIATTGASSPSDVWTIVGKLGLFGIAALVFGGMAAPRIVSMLARFRSTEILLLGSLGLCFGLALIAHDLGMSAAAGAFLIGTVLGDTKHASKINRTTMPVRDLLSAVFFVSIGMLANFAEVGRYIVPAVVVTLVVILGKSLAVTAGTFLTGHGGRASIQVGTASPQTGEFSLAMAKVGAEHGVVSGAMYPVITLTTVVTSFTYPFIYGSASAVTGFLERRSPAKLKQYSTALSDGLGILRQGTTMHGESAAAVRRALRRLLVNIGVIAALLAAGTAAVHFTSSIATPLNVSEGVIALIIGAVVITLSIPPSVMVWRALSRFMEELVEQTSFRRSVLPDRSRRLALARLLEQSLLAAALILLALWAMPLVLELLSIGGSFATPISIAIVAGPILLTARAAFQVHRGLTRTFNRTFLGGSTSRENWKEKE